MYGKYIYLQREGNVMKEDRVCETDNCDKIASKNKWGNWSKYCSKECGKTTRIRKLKEAHKNVDQDKALAKRKATNTAKFGVDNASKSDVAKQKISKASKTNAKQTVEKTKQTNLAKYGVESTNSLDSVKEKKRQAYLEKYGVDHPLKVTEIKQSVASKNKANAKERLAKAKLTNLDRYGHENPSSSDEIKDKRKEVMLDRYGVENPSQVLEFHNKKFASGYNSKEYTFPSGKTVLVQGYEDRALDILLGHYHEDEIDVHDEVPTITYYTPDGKEHRYFPDIHIPSENLIIEVKSQYTYNGFIGWYEVNLLKEQATKDAGYNFEFMIL